MIEGFRDFTIGGFLTYCVHFDLLLEEIHASTLDIEMHDKQFTSLNARFGKLDCEYAIS